MQNGDAFVIEKEDWETQIKYNIYVESIISKEKYTNTKYEELFTWLKIRASEIYKQTNNQISAPDKESFVNRLRRERESLNPKWYIDKVIFNSMFQKTLNEDKYLRLSQNILDQHGRRQKFVLWMSDFQKSILSSSQNINIGLVTYQIPKWFKAWLIIMAHWSQRNQYIPWWFWLITSTNWFDLFELIFKYLINQFRIFPNEILIPCNQSLMKAVQKWYPKSKIIGWFKDLIIKILKKYIWINPQPLSSYEDINFRVFSRISKSFFKYSNINKTIEFIESNIQSFSQESLQEELMIYIKQTLRKYSVLLDYQSLEFVTLNHIEDFWMREVVCSEENVEQCLVNFIKCIIRIENELHYYNSIKSDFSTICSEIEQEDFIDVTEINQDYYSLNSWRISQNDEQWLLNFDFDIELREIAKLQKEYANQLLDWFHQNIKSIAVKKRVIKEAVKQQSEKIEVKPYINLFTKPELFKNEIDLTIEENKKKAKVDIRKQICEILTIDD